MGLSLVCVLLTLVAISAQAREDAQTVSLPQPQPVLNKDTVSMAPGDPVQALIKKQLDAIEHRNADEAWAMTSEGLHEKYDTAKDFLGHLRMKLRPVYNHGSYEFLDQTATAHGMIQKVKMTGLGGGDPVTVIYRLKQGDKGKWLIDSFAILREEPDAQPI